MIRMRLRLEGTTTMITTFAIVCVFFFVVFFVCVRLIRMPLLLRLIALSVCFSFFVLNYYVFFFVFIFICIFFRLSYVFVLFSSASSALSSSHRVRRSVFLSSNVASSYSSLFCPPLLPSSFFFFIIITVFFFFNLSVITTIVIIRLAACTDILDQVRSGSMGRACEIEAGVLHEIQRTAGSAEIVGAIEKLVKAKSYCNKSAAAVIASFNTTLPDGNKPFDLLYTNYKRWKNCIKLSNAVESASGLTASDELKALRKEALQAGMPPLTLQLVTIAMGRKLGPAESRVSIISKVAKGLKKDAQTVNAEGLVSRKTEFT